MKLGDVTAGEAAAQCPSYSGVIDTAGRNERTDSLTLLECGSRQLPLSKRRPQPPHSKT
jgi:hypothetical protein